MNCQNFIWYKFREITNEQISNLWPQKNKKREKEISKTKKYNYNIADLDISEEEESLGDDNIPENLQKDQETLFVYDGIPKYEHFTTEMRLTMKIYYTLVYFIV